MSRSGYSDDCENLALWRWAVERAILGTRGQAFLKRLRARRLMKRVKRLIAHEFENEFGEVCALGAVDPQCAVDPDDREAVAKHFGIAPAMAAEIVYMNDEHGAWHKRRMNETPEERWARMRAWVDRQIGPDDAGDSK